MVRLGSLCAEGELFVRFELRVWLNCTSRDGIIVHDLVKIGVQSRFRTFDGRPPGDVEIAGIVRQWLAQKLHPRLPTCGL